MLHWTVTKRNGGKERAGQAVVAVGQNIYSFTDSRTYSTSRLRVCVFNTLSLRWVVLPPVTTGRNEGPSRATTGRKTGHERYGHTAVLIEDVVYIWGGVSKDLKKLYAFNVDTHLWFRPAMSGKVPDARYHHSACVLGKVMYIHGGRTRCCNLFTRWQPYHNDIYKLDTTTMVWSMINAGGVPPPVSSGHSATMVGTKMFVFGGRGYQRETCNSIRVFDTETNRWLSMRSTLNQYAQHLPDARSEHSAFAYNGELYIFGGRDYDLSFDDMWKFNPETFSWKKVGPKGKGPGPKIHMTRLCYCMVEDRIIIFGGYELPVDDLYILDLNPSLKTLCKIAVIKHGLKQSELPRNIRWELRAMT